MEVVRSGVMGRGRLRDFAPVSEKGARSPPGILAEKRQKWVLKAGKMCYALVDRQGKGEGVESRKEGWGGWGGGGMW